MPTRKQAPPRARVQVNVRLSGIENDALKTIARENGLTGAQVLRELLRAHVAQRIKGQQLRLPGAEE